MYTKRNNLIFEVSGRKTSTVESNPCSIIGKSIIGRGEVTMDENFTKRGRGLIHPSSLIRRDTLSTPPPLTHFNRGPVVIVNQIK